MLRLMCKGKIQGATLTEAKPDCVGSITIDAEIMKAAEILPFEMVHIDSLVNAAHCETYAIPGRPGEICLNVAPALFLPGDTVTILSLAYFGPAEFEATYYNTVVFVDKDNKIVKVDDQRGDEI